MNPYFALICMVALSTVGQLAVKRGAVKVVTRRGLLRLLKSMFNPFLLLGGFSVLGAPLLYMYALSKVELSIGYSFSGLTYVSVVLFGHLLLRERITPYHIVGSLVILAGLTVWNIS